MLACRYKIVVWWIKNKTFKFLYSFLFIIRIESHFNIMVFYKILLDLILFFVCKNFWNKFF
jgi:hypothetical protein